MTLGLDAIRAMVEADRLRAPITRYGEGAPSLPGALTAADEHARIRAAVEALPVPGRLSMRGADGARAMDRAAVLAAIDGERR